MEFKIEKNELNINFLARMIYNFRTQNFGNHPTRILLSVRNANKLVEEVKNQIGVAFTAEPPYKAFGIKIVRCLDIDEDTMELL